MKADETVRRLYKTGLRFLIPLTPEETYRLLVREAKKLIGAQHGSVLLWENHSFKRVYSTLSSSITANPRRNGYTQAVFRSGEPKVVDVSKLLKVHPELRTLHAESVVAVPLSYEKHIVGILYLTIKKKKKITKEKLEVLRLYGAIASLSLRKTQLHQEAMQAIETKDKLIALVAHELKTPLTTITAYVKYLEKYIHSMKGIIPQWVKELVFSTTLLNKIVNDLLAIKVVESNENIYAISKVDIPSVIDNALKRFKLVHPNAEITFSSLLNDKENIVLGNTEKLQQALQNVLENAEKFSPVFPKIRVVLEKEKDTVTIHIQDNGIGIPRKKKKKLFIPFSKMHEEHYEGLGLGLFFTKSIIEQHNGKVRINSLQKKGTEVEISLPVYYES